MKKLRRRLWREGAYLAKKEAKNEIFQFSFRNGSPQNARFQSSLIFTALDFFTVQTFSFIPACLPGV